MLDARVVKIDLTRDRATPFGRSFAVFQTISRTNELNETDL
jgi:hypothetical protein